MSFTTHLVDSGHAVNPYPSVHDTSYSTKGEPLVKIVVGHRHDSRFGGGGMHVPEYGWVTLRDWIKTVYKVKEDVYTYQLPQDVPCTPSYRAEFNAWAKEFFGYEAVAPLGKYAVINGNYYVSPACFELIYQHHLGSFNRRHHGR